jgi:benzil reductase ((S)-benzoin forming)
MNYYFITGTSRGIGKAIAELLLEDENNFITGLSRNKIISHENYRHVSIDLGDLNSVKNFKFEQYSDANRVVLINNAGTLGKVGRMGKHRPDNIINSYNVNLLSPTILINSFINTYRDVKAEKIIINVSSGAGKHPIEAWGVYCASKAALDMLSRVIQEEQAVTGEGFRIVSIAPGVVDTKMQEEIRSSSPDEFSRRNDFISYQAQGHLLDPGHAASRFIEIISNLTKINEVIFSLKEYDASISKKIQ